MSDFNSSVTDTETYTCAINGCKVNFKAELTATKRCRKAQIRIGEHKLTVETNSINCFNRIDRWLRETIGVSKECSGGVAVNIKDQLLKLQTK